MLKFIRYTSEIMAFIDYYKLLEIDKTASADQIKKPIESWLENIILM